MIETVKDFNYLIQAIHEDEPYYSVTSVLFGVGISQVDQ